MTIEESTVAANSITPKPGVYHVNQITVHGGNFAHSMTVYICDGKMCHASKTGAEQPGEAATDRQAVAGDSAPRG